MAYENLDDTSDLSAEDELVRQMLLQRAQRRSQLQGLDQAAIGKNALAQSMVGLGGLLESRAQGKPSSELAMKQINSLPGSQDVAQRKLQALDDLATMKALAPLMAERKMKLANQLAIEKAQEVEPLKADLITDRQLEVDAQRGDRRSAEELLKRHAKAAELASGLAGKKELAIQKSGFEQSKQERGFGHEGAKQNRAFEIAQELASIKNENVSQQLKEKFHAQWELIPEHEKWRLKAQLELLSAAGDKHAQEVLHADIFKTESKTTDFERQKELKALSDQYATASAETKRLHDIEMEKLRAANKETLKKVPAPAKPPGSAGAKEPKKDQFDAAAYGRRVQQAEQIFGDLQSQGYDPTSYKNALIQHLPDFAQPEEAKRLNQAQRNFVNAILRRESGAAISSSEFDSAEKQYFPKAGDTPQVIAQKLANRQQAFESLKAAAGPAWDRIPGIVTPNLPQSAGGGVPKNLQSAAAQELAKRRAAKGK